MPRPAPSRFRPGAKRPSRSRSVDTAAVSATSTWPCSTPRFASSRLPLDSTWWWPRRSIRAPAPPISRRTVHSPRARWARPSAPTWPRTSAPRARSSAARGKRGKGMGAMLEHPEGRPTSRHFDCRHDEQGREIVEAYVDGMALLRLVLVNKGTAFTEEERRQLCLDGLLPPRVNTLEQQVERTYQLYRAAPTPLDRYQFLRSLQERTEILFHALLTRHLGEMLPIVYTPTVGDAVKRFSALYQSPRGLQLSPLNIGRVSEILRHYPLNDVRMIVATDSSAILGIGDQGYGGLGIPIGKLALYTAAGGVSPFHTMPVVLDVGTERQDLIDDPMYLGVPQRRLKGDAYLAFLDQFVAAVKERWPAAIIQWEDLSKDTAFTVLERYRKQVPSFNDDIQGTGAVTLAGVLQACRIKGERLADQRIVIHGAGAGGAGVAWAMIQGLVRDGVPVERARTQVMVLDSKGLLTTSREMEQYKRVYAQPHEQVK